MIRNVLMIDNHDSFTFNIVEALERLGATVRTVRNEISAVEALEQAVASEAMILISPGPGRPEDAGCCLELISMAKGKVPLFGVCLGQQAMVLEAGGEVVRANQAVHGKASLINTEKDGRKRENSLNAVPIRQIYERWMGPFAELWSSTLLRMKDDVEKKR